MRTKSFLAFIFLYCGACNSTDKKFAVGEQRFNKVKWHVFKEEGYPFRERMLADLIDNYKMSGLKKEEILNLLGTPDRTDAGYLFYTIAQPHWGILPLSTKSLVIKLTKDSIVEWRKIHK